MTKTEIKAIRAKFGHTTRRFAESVGVSPRTVEGWEQGRPVSKLARLAIQSIVRGVKPQPRASGG